MIFDGDFRDTSMQGIFFSDTTEDYVTPVQPDLYGKVAIRLRVAKGRAKSCFLVTEEQYLHMHLTESDVSFDYFSVRFEVTGSPLRYYFEIFEEGRKYKYTRRGVRNTIRKADWWHIIPGFHTPSWAEGAVMYQIFVDRFCNGDPSNDVLTGEYDYMGMPVLGIKDWKQNPSAKSYREFYGGDLQGVISKLDYLQDLGVEAIYLNPIFLSPSCHKYDTQDYEHIDPHFGRIVRDEGELLFRAKPQAKKGGTGRRGNTGSEGDGIVSGNTVAGKNKAAAGGVSALQYAGPDGGQVREEDLFRGRRTNRKASRYLCRVTDPANLEASDMLFAKLVREAHRRGIRVILDGVFNHCGSFHRWLDREKIYEQLPGGRKGAVASKRSPYVKYFKFEKDEWPLNDSYDSWWGFATLPKLNYENSEKLCEDILEIGRKWVSPPYNADGWRLDVAADLGYSADFNHSFWKRFRKAVKEANPEAIILAENYTDSQNWLQGDEWDTIMNYEFFMEPVTSFLTGMEKHSDRRNEDCYGDPESFWRAVLCMNQDAMPDTALRISMNELSNHDHSRFLTRTNRVTGRVENLGPEAACEGVDMQIMRQAVLLQMTWTGAPTIYYGDEAGMTGFTDPDNRRTYPWGDEDQNLIEYHRFLARLRRKSPTLRRGSLLRLPDEDGLLAYARFARGKEKYIVLININHIPIEYRADITVAGIPSRAELECLLRTDSSGWTTDSSSHNTYTSDGILRIILPPQSGILLCWKPEGQAHNQ